MAEYIEREAALMELCRGCSLHGISDSFFCGEPCSKYERIASVPSADVAHVRHGRWIKKHDDVCYWHECSECGIKPPKDQWKNEWKSPYCHNCGAKMDKEEEK